ncbi:hypothetical protein ACH427_26535 [Streptomyces sp. NPDC020379]|uniref:hypothetical protein n=1 Tax=Streptomyces sp. NPDC020379 TaxID=3365071 RepID=UPI0037AD82E1
MNEQNRDGYNDFMAVLKSVDSETVAADTGSGAEWAGLKAAILSREERALSREEGTPSRVEGTPSREEREEQGETADEEAVSDEPAVVISPPPALSAGQLTAHLVPLVVLAVGVMAWTTFQWMWVRIVGVGLILLAFLGNDLLRLLRDYRAERRPDRGTRRRTGMAASALTAAAVTAVASVVPDIGH